MKGSHEGGMDKRRKRNKLMTVQIRNRDVQGTTDAGKEKSAAGISYTRDLHKSPN